MSETETFMDTELRTVNDLLRSINEDFPIATLKLFDESQNELSDPLQVRAGKCCTKWRIAAPKHLTFIARRTGNLIEGVLFIDDEAVTTYTTKPHFVRKDHCIGLLIGKWKCPECRSD